MISQTELESARNLQYWLRGLQVLNVAAAILAAGIWAGQGLAIFRVIRLGVIGIAAALVFQILEVVCSWRYGLQFDECLAGELEDYRAGCGDRFLLSSVNETGLVKAGGYCVAQGEFSARYKGFPFCWAFVKLEGECLRFPHFRGTWIIFDRPMQFEHPLLILDRSLLTAGDPLCGDRKMYNVPMSDPKFASVFRVRSENLAWAEEFLDPALQRRLLALKERAGGKLLVGFIGQEIHVACTRRRSSVHIPLFGNGEEFMERFYREHVTWVQEVIDTLWFT